MKRFDRTRTLPFLAAAFALLFVGCEGPTGPEGPAGLVGLQGEQGPTGSQGPPGAANVQAITFTLTEGAFDNSSSSIQIATRSMPELTAAVVSAGAVLAYTDIGTGLDVWTVLPFVLITPGGTASTLSYVYSAGLFQTLILKNTFVNLASVYAGSRIHVVIIPPTSTSALNRVDRSDYQAVHEALGL